MNSETWREQPQRFAFTLTELIVVLGLTSLLLLALCPARAGSRTKAQGIRCLDNARQIIAAIELYTQDDHDLLPPNPDDGTALPGYTWCVGQAGIGGSDQFDPDILSDVRRCVIAAYLNTNVSLFRCTADTRTGKYDGAGLYPNSPLIGKVVPAARTISMSQAVGTIDPQYSNSGGGHSGIPNLPVKGPWLTGAYGQNNAVNGPYRTYGKLSQMVIPTPAQLNIITEEAPLSINDAGCATTVNPSSPGWIDYPSTLHNNGCVLSFADGHVELHKWTGSTLFLSGPPGFLHVFPTDPDWVWFAQRTSARMR